MRCWWIFFHRWGKWNSVFRYEIVDSDDGCHTFFPAQERYCEVCNRRQVRKAKRHSK